MAKDKKILLEEQVNKIQEVIDVLNKEFSNDIEEEFLDHCKRKSE